jgi:hypothetical protein
MGIDTKEIPGFLFFDHVAVSVKQGDLENQVAAYKAMGFTEIHREDERTCWEKTRCAKFCCESAMGRI